MSDITSNKKAVTAKYNKKDDSVYIYDEEGRVVNIYKKCDNEDFALKNHRKFIENNNKFKI